jgi:isopentenyl-diphosphate delta-isomerase type 1
MRQFETTDERQVVLCNHDGEPTGVADIATAHRGEGQLHRAFSVFVFRYADQSRELLIQRRSAEKLLFAGRWANTCCSHPAPDDQDICLAGAARLRVECGFSVPLRAVGSFVYRASDPHTHGAEYEHDTVLVGAADLDVKVAVDPKEVADYRWITPQALETALDNDELDFAPWFRQAWDIASVSVRAEDG